MTRQLKFLYFDMGNVLLKFDHGLGCANMAAVAGVSRETVQSLVFDSDLQTDYESGQITTQQFYDTFCEQTDTRPPYADLVHAAANIFQLNAPILPLLEQLKQAGHAMGILSNTCDAHWQFIQQEFPELVSHFDVFAMSHEIGCMKPEDRIYQAATELSGCEIDEIFFTDDRDENVLGAREGGMDALLFTTAEALTRELQSRHLIS